MDDLEFVQLCANGNQPAWNEFCKKYSRLIYNYILAVLRAKFPQGYQQNQAEDLFQEVFVLLSKDDFQKLKSFKAKNSCSLASWLRQVTVNHTIDHLRRYRPAVSLDQERGEDLKLVDILADFKPLASKQLIGKEESLQLKDCIKELSVDDKYFLDLYLGESLSPEKLSQVLRISRNAVDMRKFRILERLKQCFKLKGFL